MGLLGLSLVCLVWLGLLWVRLGLLGLLGLCWVWFDWGWVCVRFLGFGLVWFGLVWFGWACKFNTRLIGVSGRQEHHEHWFRGQCLGGVVPLQLMALLRHCCGAVASLVALLRHCCGTVVALLRHCCGTVASLLRHCCVTVASLLRYCCLRVTRAVPTVGRVCAGPASVRETKERNLLRRTGTR